MADSSMTGVLVILQVPKHWPGLPVEEIERKLRANEPEMTRMLAGEVKRWGNTGTMNLTELRRFLDDRGVEAPNG